VGEYQHYIGCGSGTPPPLSNPPSKNGKVRVMSPGFLDSIPSILGLKV